MKLAKTAFAPLIAVSLLSSTGKLRAQDNFLQAWEARVRATSARQPAWPVPVVSPSSVIVQLARVDFVRQYTSTQTTTWNYDNGKGVNLIPFARTEFDINLPPYIQHNNPKVQDGAGDVSFVAKYRMFSANEGSNYSVAAQAAFSVPTGSYKNGTAVSTITPTIIGGKGFGRFDVQSAIGAVLPTSSSATIGRTISWNTVAQYKVGKYFWPELAQRFDAAFRSAGGQDEFILAPAFGDDGHHLFGGGIEVWTPMVDAFLKSHDLQPLPDPLPEPTPPNIPPPAGLSEHGQQSFHTYLTLGPHKAFAMSEHHFAFVTAQMAPQDAVKKALENCNKNAMGSGERCHVAFIDESPGK